MKPYRLGELVREEYERRMKRRAEHVCVVCGGKLFGGVLAAKNYCSMDCYLKREQNSSRAREGG